jgi:hypothetical protein
MITLHRRAANILSLPAGTAIVQFESVCRRNLRFAAHFHKRKAEAQDDMQLARKMYPLARFGFVTGR